jgi:hypothetical protein
VAADDSIRRTARCTRSIIITQVRAAGKRRAGRDRQRDGKHAGHTDLKAFMIGLLRNRGCIIIIIFALGKLKIAAAVFLQRALL